MCVLFAATYPARAQALVLYGTYAKRLRTDDYPWAPTWEERVADAEYLERHWGEEFDLGEMAPNAPPDLVEWAGVRGRAGLSPRGARDLILMNSKADVREVLPLVQAPTLVLHRTGDRDANVEEGRYIAERIPGAKFVELAGDDHIPFVNPDQILDEVEEFLTGAKPGAGVRARARDGALHRPRRLDREGARARRSRLGRAARAASRGRSGVSSRASAARRSTPPATASSRSARGRPARSAARSRSSTRSAAGSERPRRCSHRRGGTSERRLAARHRRTRRRARRRGSRRERGARQLDDERSRRRLGHRARGPRRVRAEGRRPKASLRGDCLTRALHERVEDLRLVRRPRAAVSHRRVSAHGIGATPARPKRTSSPKRAAATPTRANAQRRRSIAFR